MAPYVAISSKLFKQLRNFGAMTLRRRFAALHALNSAKLAVVLNVMKFKDKRRQSVHASYPAPLVHSIGQKSVC